MADWRHPGGGRARVAVGADPMTSRLLTLGAFGACLVALVVLGLLARVRPAWVSDPETLFARLMARRATRVAMTLAWACIGRHFLVTPPS